jgi:hypothetical protein
MYYFLVPLILVFGVLVIVLTVNKRQKIIPYLFVANVVQFVYFVLFIAYMYLVDCINPNSMFGENSVFAYCVTLINLLFCGIAVCVILPLNITYLAFYIYKRIKRNHS